MITFPVDLKDVNEVIDFVNLANKVDYDVDLRYVSYQRNAHKCGPFRCYAGARRLRG